MRPYNEEMTPELRREMEHFKRFLTQKRLGQVETPIAKVTADKYEDHLR